MSASTLITDGFGSFGNIARIIMHGLSPRVAEAAVVSHRRTKKYGKGYLKRDGEILVFETEQLAEEYVEAEIKELLAPNRKERRIVVAKRPKPVEAVSVAVIEKEASAANVMIDTSSSDLAHLLAVHHRIVQMQDDADVELLVSSMDDDIICEMQELINYAMSRMKH